MKKNICIIGAGGFAREVAWLIEHINEKTNEWNILGYIDDNQENHGKNLIGYEVLGGIDYLNSLNDVYAIIAIGNGEVREKIIKKLKNPKFPILIHPDVKISKSVEIGEGTIICSQNLITVDIKIGKHVILNLDVTIGHDAILCDYVTILPGVHVSGNVLIKEKTTLGTGSVVIQGITIGESSMIGAGAVVVKEIPNKCTAVGNPAKVIKYHD